MPNFDRTWLISVKRSSDRNSGRQRLKMECATCNTPLLTTVLSGVSREIRSSTRVSHRCQKSLSAMANLAEGIQGLVKNMRNEQQMLRDWIEAQQEESKTLRRTLDRLSEKIGSK